jgi:hypothetical protein
MMLQAATKRTKTPATSTWQGICAFGVRPATMLPSLDKAYANSSLEQHETKEPGG